MTRRVLVTGGAGFVGSHVADRLVDDGDEVHVLDDLSVGSRDRLPDDASLHRIDLRDRDAVLDCVEDVDPDAAIHLAALHYIPYCNDNPEEAFDVNVMGTRHLLEACRIRTDGLDGLVYASTAAVYPPREDHHAVGDTVDPMDVYGRTKLAGEDLLSLHARRTGDPATALRLFNVFGTRETNPHLIPAILDQLEDGSRAVELGNLSPQRDFVHVTDVARAVTSALDAGGGADATDEGAAVYNVGTGEPRSVREVVAAVGEALGDEIAIEQDEDRVRESDRPFLAADTAGIRRDLGWKPAVDFVAGLEELLRERGIGE